jgi:hypothetical protein
MLSLQSKDEALQILANTALEEFAAEFGREYYMVPGVKNCVRLSAILHLLTLTEDSGTHPSAGCRPQFFAGNKKGFCPLFLFRLILTQKFLNS